MAKLYSPGYSTGGNQIGTNSIAFVSGDLVAIKSGFVDKAVAGDTIVGISLETKTMASDNQTGVQEVLEFAALADNTILKIEVTNGTIAQANVGQLFDLTATQTVDGATAGTGTSLRLKEVLSTGLGLFVRAK